MVQYIFTPWRDRRELLAVRRQFYPALDGETRAASPEAVQRVEAGQHAAVARVAVWMQRGHCPHMVESTALLMAAALADEGASSPRGLAPSLAGSMQSSSSAYTARATYAAAFSRFVTGLLDGQQDRARKLSMHGLAQTVGLPPGFVELRHQATHEALPALRRLRVAARQALAWIWGYYWANLEEPEDAAAPAGEMEVTTTTSTAAKDDTDRGLRETLLQYVDSEDLSTSIPTSLVSRWGEAEVLAELAVLGAEEEGRALRCIRLSRKLLKKEEKEDGKKDTIADSTEPKPTRARAKGKPAAPSQATTPAKDAAKPASTAPGSTAPSWTMGNLNLEAMRAAMAQSRQALYQEGDEEAKESKKEEEAEADEEDGQADNEKDQDQDEGADIIMAEDEPEQRATAPEPELPSQNPRWTRYVGEWTPKPIGVV